MKKVMIFSTLIASIIFLSSFQKATTTLKIMVYDNLGKVQEGAKVRIYKTKEDYEKDVNFVAELLTNKNGNAEFINLVAQVYYVSAIKGDKDNSSNGVVTEKLEDDRLNKMKIIISD